MTLPEWARPRRLAAGAVTVAVLFAVAAVVLRSPPPPAAFRTEPVTRGELRVVVAATGNVKPTNQVDVGSELSGTVAAVRVDDNDRVRKGQVLAQLDTSKLASTVARAEAALRTAEARVRQAEATSLETRTDLERLRRMRELSRGEVPSASELQAAEARLARGVADEAAARAAVQESRAAWQFAGNDLAKATIRSPIDGVVLARNVEPGQTVAASLQAPVLFTLAEDLARMELTADVDEADVGLVRAGQPATFTVDAWPDRTYPATLTRVSFGSRTTDGVVSYQATLAVDNADLSLRPGMTATATIEALRKDGVLLVPNSALRFTPPPADTRPQGSTLVSKLIPRPPQQAPKRAGVSNKTSRQHVYVLVDGAPRAVEVTVGRSNGRQTELVDGGLAEGAQVIVEYAGAAP